MAKVKLHDSEFAQLTKYKTRLQQTREQVLAVQAEADKRTAQLIAQGDELATVLNTTWLAANRRVKIEDPEYADVDFPPMVNEMGEQMVNLKAKDKTAHWESVHDVKRIASESEAFQEKCDVEQSTVKKDEEESENGN
jgi:hypothetical protein